ncbi:hypothetical protein ACWEO4_42990 [Streptomyces sp. NPDC004393]
MAKYSTHVTVGWSVGDSRYSSGVPLVNDHGPCWPSSTRSRRVVSRVVV